MNIWHLARKDGTVACGVPVYPGRLSTTDFRSLGDSEEICEDCIEKGTLAGDARELHEAWLPLRAELRRPFERMVQRLANWLDR